jgi:hypothetical protein
VGVTLLVVVTVRSHGHADLGPTPDQVWWPETRYNQLAVAALFGCVTFLVCMWLTQAATRRRPVSRSWIGTPKGITLTVLFGPCIRVGGFVVSTFVAAFDGLHALVFN